MVVKRVKVIALVLAVLMVGTLILSGCGSGAGNEDSGVKATTQVSSKSDQGTKEPEKKLELTWLIAYDASSYKEGSKIETTLEEKFGVDLKVLPINAMDTEKFNVTIASGTIPDVIVRWDSQKLYNDEIVRSISQDMIKENMPESYKAIEETGGTFAWEQCKGYKDGKLFAIPQINASGAARLVLAARQDWIDSVGITALPKTLDELHTLAKAFTFNDPDKNGKKDTYGLGGAGLHPTPLFWQFQTIFGAFGVHPEKWVEEDGKVVFGPVANGYKEALKTLGAWYKEGIIDPEFVTDQNANYGNKVASGVLGLYDGHPTYFDSANKTQPVVMATESNPKAKFVFLDPPVGPKGKSGAISYGVIGSWSMMFGSKTSDEKVVKAMQIAEALNTDIDLFKLTFAGIEGEHYDLAGDQCVMKQGIVDAEQGIKMFRTGSYLSMDVVKTFLSKNAINLITPTVNHPLIISIVDPDRLTTLNADKINKEDMSKAIKEFYFNAITGKVDIDAKWDSYVKNWMDMGGKLLTEEAQKATRLDK